MLSLLLRGTLLGVTAAILPGPYQMYLVTQASRHGWRATMPLALVPLLSDLPIVLVLVVAISQMPSSVLTIIGFAGGLFLLYLAYEAWRASSQPIESNSEVRSTNLLRGTVMNLVNPNPWIFWSLTGVPILLEGYKSSLYHAIIFLVGFYVAMASVNIAQIILFASAARVGPKFNHTLQKLAAIGLALFGLYQLYRASGLYI